MHIRRIEVHGTDCCLLQGEAGIMLIDPSPPSDVQASSVGQQ
jgi:hypothetical protein